MRKVILLVALALTVPFVFYGCSGDDGATGATGATGAPGQIGPGGPTGPPGAAVARVTDFHGEDALATQEFQDPAVQKYRANVTITSATADASGVVTVNFTVKKASDNSPVTNLPNPPLNNNIGAGIFKLVPAGGGFSYNRWVPYIWRIEEVEGTTDSAGNAFLEPDGFQVNQGYRENSGTGASNGTLVNHADGSYTYTFKQNLTTAKRPVDNVAITYERNRTHRVIITMGGHTGATGEGDFDFVPDGTAGSGTRNIVQTATCKKCHGPEFAGHGGDRVTVEGCVTCHSPDSKDAQSGESIEMAVMIHKIHAGNELASVAGADNAYYDNPWTPANETLDNGKYILWGNSVRAVSWEGAAFPAVLSNCQSCHTGSGADVDNWKNVPSRAACGSCHDRINFAAGTGHFAQTSDAGCSGCHPATGTGAGQSVTGAHDWTAKDIRNIPEFNVALSVNTPSRGYFISGESPVISIALTDNNGTPIVPASIIQDPAGEGCIPNAAGTACQGVNDGLFTAASMYVTGPRAQRIPVLSYAARAVVRATGTGTGPWDLSGNITIRLLVDSGMQALAYNNVFEYEGYGADELISGDINITRDPTRASASDNTFFFSFFANPAAATPAEVAAWLNAIPAFNERAIAYVEENSVDPNFNNVPGNRGKLAIRSRGISEMEITATGEIMVKKNTAQPNVRVVTSTPGIFATTGSGSFGAAGGAATVRIPTTQANIDPKADFSNPTTIGYYLDKVDDLAPGTYMINVEFGDRGRGPSVSSGGINPPEPPYVDYRTPSVAVATFQVKQAAKEKPVADGCTACHWSDASGAGFVLDYPRHNKIFDNNAVDQCGGCHMYKSGMNAATTLSIADFGTKPLSRRAHAVHNGSKLNYPTITVGHEETSAFGRNWRITYPMDIRNCESCHSGATSGTWNSNPNRLACMGCHDADGTTEHMNAMTYDPTPLAPWSGDEKESCKQCH